MDFRQDITATSVTLLEGVTTVIFTRLIDTGDSNDIALNQPRYLLWAFGGTVEFGDVNNINYHANNRGAFQEQIDLTLCSTGKLMIMICVHYCMNVHVSLAIANGACQ